MNIRMAALYREEAAQAKTNYAIIAENIRKLCNSASYFQCTLPNRPEMTELKTALLQLFQEIKNRHKTTQLQTYTSSYVTNADKEHNSIISEFKEGLLEIISLLMPTQTMKTGVNRQKSMNELVKIAKDLIK